MNKHLRFVPYVCGRMISNSSRTRLAVTVTAVVVVLLVYYNGSESTWISNASSYGAYRFIPRIAYENLTFPVVSDQKAAAEEGKGEVDSTPTETTHSLPNSTAPLSTSTSLPSSSSTPTTSAANLTSTTTLTPIVFPPNETRNVPPLRFRRRTVTSSVDCGRALNNDKEYMKSLAENRIVMTGPPEPMDCPSIRKRILPPRPLKPTGFGVAFARVVYKDYEFIEDEVRAVFHPENVFCFVLDTKSSKQFREQLKQLASCLPNVLAMSKEFNVDGGGHNMNAAHYECMTAVHKMPNWDYLLLLQNHDMLIRTPFELVALYKEMGGANDVELTRCPEDRIPPSLRYKTTKELRLFRNESLATEKQLKATLQFAKGAAQASLSREAVRWLVEVIDLPLLIEAFNSHGNFVDEQLYQMLQVSEGLDMPGRFTSVCTAKGHNVDFVSRMSHWVYGAESECASGKTRHAICLLGLEDLHFLAKYPNIMVNKFMPDFDYAGIDCVHELMFNRTFLEVKEFDTSYYREMVNVKFHKVRKAFPGADTPVSCAAPHKTWSQSDYVS